MILFKKGQSKLFVALALAIVFAFSLLAGLKFSYLSVSAEEVEYTTYELGVLQFRQMEPDNNKMAYFGLSDGNDAPYSEPSENVRWNSVFTLVADSGVGVTINGETANATIKVPGAVFVEFTADPSVDDILVIEGTFYNEGLAVKYVIYKSKFVWNGSAWEDYTTEVKGIICDQRSDNVYFGFELTKSDYTVSFGSDFGGTEYVSKYEEYITIQCSYWKNFKYMNSEGKIFPQTFAYWNGGSGQNVLGATFANTVAHRSTLKIIEYGFMITIPAGTTFPSYNYVISNWEEEPVFYTTVSDKAFYYDGNSFVEFAYSVAMERIALDEYFADFSPNDYIDDERRQVEELVADARKKVKFCVSTFEMDELMNDFSNALAKLMTKEDYDTLETQKTQAKAKVDELFNALNESDYNQTAWAEILSIKEQGKEAIDLIKNLGETSYVLTAIQRSFENVVNLADWATFETYRQSAITRLENSFISSLYAEEEQALGSGFVTEGKQKILECVTYNAVDVLEAEYISKVRALKVMETEEPEPQNLGWIFIIIGGAALLAGAGVSVVLIILKNKKKERKGEQNEE